MSNEEMNKKMEFIVEQQSKFAAEIEIMREVQAADAKLLKEQERTIRCSNAVVGFIGNLTRTQTRTDESIRLLTEAQRRTDERLNIFINVVERYISGSGGSQNPA